MQAEEQESSATVERKRPGARIGHKGYHRPVPDHVDVEVTLREEECPECFSKLSDPVDIRYRIVESIPLIRPTVTRYTIERRYCRNCRKIVEPQIRDVLPNASLSLRTMLIIAYHKTVERVR